MDLEQTARLRFHAYCGMHVSILEGELQECRNKAARMIRRHRKSDREVSVLTNGYEWEFLEDENAMMVEDDCGILEVILDGCGEEDYDEPFFDEDEP